METNWIARAAGACFVVGAIFLSGTETKIAGAYPHGTVICLQGNDGAGVRLRLRQTARCEGGVSYPYLDIDIRELPVSRGKRIRIGPLNWAFLCPDPKQSCEQLSSGTIVFDHFEDSDGKYIQTDGYYELISRNGKSERGHFQADCFSACA